MLIRLEVGLCSVFAVAIRTIGIKFSRVIVTVSLVDILSFSKSSSLESVS